MRVVAGSARGRRLVGPQGRDTRPTSDRVREAVFNALHSIGALEGARVLDLFAGSGALGIEALSRGASAAVFVESERSALAAIRTNLAGTGLADRAEVVAGDAVRFCATTARRFDLGLADPPYAFDAWPQLAAVLPADMIVAESDRIVELGAGWAVTRERRYGGTVVVFGRRAGDPAWPPPSVPGRPEPSPP